MCDTTNILRFVLDSICFLQGYLNNPINNIKIALPTDHVSHMAKGHICEKPTMHLSYRNKYFLTYRNVLISKLQTALIFSIVISVLRSIQRIIMSMVEHLSSHQIALMHLM